MAIHLKQLQDQVIVITGATSGIGLTTARAAARRGARLVLAARSGEALGELERQLQESGARVATVATDVGVEAEVDRLAAMAVERFGRIDTWVNNAGISVFGKLHSVPTEDLRRLFDTNFWGIVYGSRAALRHYRARGGPGAIINLGSEVSDAPIPLQGMYAASKHAVKAFTNALRIELEKERVPVAVTLIKPAAIDTMFTAHARNYMDKEPSLPAPVYAPELVADTILYCAEHPKREQYVGGAAMLHAANAGVLPRVYDRMARLLLFRQQKSPQASRPRRTDALYGPDGSSELRQRGAGVARVHERSPATTFSLHTSPVGRAMIGGGVLLAAWSLTRRMAR